MKHMVRFSFPSYKGAVFSI